MPSMYSRMKRLRAAGGRTGGCCWPITTPMFAMERLFDEVGIVFSHPVEVFARRLQPAAILAHAVLAADDVVIRDHSRASVSLNHICSSCGDL
mgnify:CR=1 FL=1